MHSFLLSSIARDKGWKIEDFTKDFHMRCVFGLDLNLCLQLVLPKKFVDSILMIKKCWVFFILHDKNLYWKSS